MLNFFRFFIFQIPPFFCFLFLSNYTTAQDFSDIYARQIDTNLLKSYLYKLTSDSLTGRETGTLGQIKAANFIKDHFIKTGLLPASKDTFQYHPLSLKANKGGNLLVDSSKFLFRKDYFFISESQSSILSIQSVILISNTKPVSIKKKYIKTDFAFLLEKNYPFRNDLITMDQQIKNLTTSTPKLVFIYSGNIDSVSRLWSGFERSKDKIIDIVKNFPFKVVWIGDSILASINKRRSSNKITKQGQAFHCDIIVPLKNTSSMTGCNVPFFLSGTASDSELIIVTAHYDHLGIKNDTIFRGADDDASGTSTVMELARVFAKASKEGHPPLRSILFMPVSGEEKGLLGSSYYVQYPLFPLSNTIANINIDMVGRTDPRHDSLGKRDYVYIIGDDKLSTQLHDISVEMNEKYTKLDLDYRYNGADDPNRFYYRSDHYNFAKNNIPVIFYFNGTHADYHKSTDTPDKICFDLMKHRARLIFNTIWELANRPARITVDRSPDPVQH